MRAAKWKITNTSHIQYIGIVVRRNTRAPLTEAESVVFILVYACYLRQNKEAKTEINTKSTLQYNKSDRKKEDRRKNIILQKVCLYLFVLSHFCRFLLLFPLPLSLYVYCCCCSIYSHKYPGFDVCVDFRYFFFFFVKWKTKINACARENLSNCHIANFLRLFRIFVGFFSS